MVRRLHHPLRCHRLPLALAAAACVLAGCFSSVHHSAPRVVDLAPAATGDQVELLLHEDDTRYTSYPGRHAAQATTLAARLRVLAVPARAQDLPLDRPGRAGLVVRETDLDHTLENHRVGAGLLFDGAARTTWRWCRIEHTGACTPVAERSVDDQQPTVLLSPDRRSLWVDCTLLDAATELPRPVAVTPAACRQFIDDAHDQLHNAHFGTEFGLRGDGWLVAWRPFAEPGADDWAWALHLPTGRRQILHGPAGPHDTVEVRDVQFDGPHGWLLANYFDCPASSTYCQDAFVVLSPETGERVALPAAPFKWTLAPRWWDVARRRFFYIASEAGHKRLAVQGY